MKKGFLLERLVQLYLRLNGFLTSGYVAHSPRDARNRTEIDFLAVRFPHHSEPERAVPDDSYLELSKTHIEFCICEVKGGRKSAHFNYALYSSREAISSTVRWIGIFAPKKVDEVTSRLQQLLTPSSKPNPMPLRFEVDNIRIRPLLFRPEIVSLPRDNQQWYIPGEILINHIFKCLRPPLPRSTCATNYSATQWGDLAKYVNFFKSWDSKKPPSIKEIILSFEAE